MWLPFSTRICIQSLPRPIATDKLRNKKCQEAIRFFHGETFLKEHRDSRCKNTVQEDHRSNIVRSHYEPNVVQKMAEMLREEKKRCQRAMRLASRALISARICSRHGRSRRCAHWSCSTRWPPSQGRSENRGRLMPTQACSRPPQLPPPEEFCPSRHQSPGGTAE